MILYDFPESGNGYKVRLLFTHLGIPYSYEALDYRQGDTRSKSFLAKNAFGKIPTLESKDGVLFRESNAILMHFARGTDLLPEDKLLQTRVLEWLFWEQYEHEPAVAVLRSWHIKGYLTEMGVEAVAEKRNDANRALKQLDDALEGKSFLVGDRFTIADIALFAYTHLAEDAALSLENFSNVKAWCKRIEAMPSHVSLSDSAKSLLS